MKEYGVVVRFKPRFGATGIAPHGGIVFVFREKLRRPFRWIEPFFAVLALLLPFFAAIPVSAEAPVWLPRIDLGGKAGDQRSLGQVELFLPLAQDGKSLLFLNPRLRFDDDGSREYGAGLGYRQRIGKHWIVGGYGFIDRLQSETDNQFFQGVVGMEGLATDWDIRINGYVPLGDNAKPVAGASGPATAFLSGGTIVVNSTNVDEYALHGADAEIGWRVPFFDAEAHQQLRIFAGGFWFDAEGEGVQEITGPRGSGRISVARPRLVRHTVTPDLLRRNPAR